MRIPDGEIKITVKEKLKYYCAKPLLTELRQYVSDDKYHRILALNDDEKFFENLYEILFPSKEISPSNTVAEIEILELERCLNELGNIIKFHEDTINSLMLMIAQQQKRIEHLENITKEN